MKARAWLLALGASLALSSAALPQARPPSQRSGPITVYGPITSDDKITGNSMQAGPITAQTLTSGTVNITAEGSTGPGGGFTVKVPDGSAVARALTARFRDLPVYPQDYWPAAQAAQFCDGATDVSSAYRAAASVAMSTGRTLHIGGGTGVCVIGSKIPISGRISMQGDGPNASVLVGTFNGPIFEWAATNAEVASSLVSGFTLRGQFAADADYSQSAGFYVLGGSTSAFFQYNRFRTLVFESLFAAFDFATDSFTTSFGQENTSAWLTFDDITIRGGSRVAVKGFRFRNGSGTGTTFSNIKTIIGDPTGAVFSYDLGVVGDIVINGGHFGGTPGAKLIEVGQTTGYRSNILISGSQLDAGMNVPFNLPTNGPVFSRVSFTGNNLGGSVVLNYPPAANSLIDDQLADYRRAGKEATVPGTGATTVPLFAVTLDSLTPYTGAACTITVSGLVGGIGGGVVQSTFMIGRNGSDPNVVAGTSTASVALAQFFAVTAVPVAGTGRVTINATLSPSAAPSNLNGQIRCSGGVYAITRL
jgi:hypothetical protein